MPNQIFGMKLTDCGVNDVTDAMIYSFGGRNFFSFQDAFEVDFRVSPQASERNIFKSDSRGQKCNVVTGVFGANASGKTHLLQSLGFLQWFIVHSAQSKPSERNWENLAFRFTPAPEARTELSLEFEMHGQHYRYDLALDPVRVVQESLRVRRTRFVTLFERTWNGSAYRFKSQDFGQNAGQVPQRENASFISTALLLENTFARQLDAFFTACYGNLHALGRSSCHDPSVINLFAAAEFFEEHPEHLAWVNYRLSGFDLGLQRIEMKTVKVPTPEGKLEDALMPMSVHHHGGRDYMLSLLEESTGTQALFVLLRYILPVLHSGGVAFIDEFEHGLHSHMIPCLLDLFYSPKHNPKGAQLIFSSHADYIIGQLEKYQVQLVNKDVEGVSTTHRLDELKGVRNVDNLHAKYHAGAYGGVPIF
jgi:uncharacterized protein